MFTQTEITEKGIKLEIPKIDREYSYELIGYLKSLYFSAKALPISYRILNHWEQRNIIKSLKRDGTEWRRFTFFETVWIYILSELREYGFSLTKAKTVREMLFGVPITNKMKYEEIDENLTLQFMFEVDCVNSLLGRRVFYGIDKSGGLSPYAVHNLNSSRANSSLLVINLHSIMEKLFVDCKMDPSYSPSLTREERKIIFLIRENKYKEVKITYKNNKPDVFFGVQVLENYKRIAEIMKEHSYQDIAITEIGGKVSHIKRTIKRKIAD